MNDKMTDKKFLELWSPIPISPWQHEIFKNLIELRREQQRLIIDPPRVSKSQAHAMYMKKLKESGR